MQKRFAEQRARADARERGYKESQPSGLDNLIRVLGQAGQYKGFSGIGPAYTALQQQRRAEDLAFQKQQDELMTAIEGREYGADKDVFSTRSTAMDRAQQSFTESEKSILAAATKQAEMAQGILSNDNKARMALDMENYKVTQEAINQDKNRASQEKLKGMDIAQRDRALKASASGGADKSAEYVALLAQSRAELEKGTPESIRNAKELKARADSMMEWKGGSGGGGGAGMDNAETRKLRDAASDIDKELEFIDPKSPRYAELIKLRQDISKRIVNRAIGDAGGSPSKVMTQADVLATARSSGKTPQQVIEAAKARGFTIQ